MSHSVLVTGGASGIGLAIANAFSRQGDRVLLADINDNVHKVASEMSTAAAPVSGFVVDLAVESQVLALAEAAKKLFGTCDVLVNCAGISMKRNGEAIPPTELSLEDWTRVQDINLTAPFLLCRELIPGMKEKRRGRIVNITSRAGRTYVASAGLEYTASKAGLIGLTRHLGGLYASFGITVNCIAPGRIETPLANLSSPDAIAKSLKAIPAGRQGTTAEIAGAAVFFASDAAAYVTGTVLDVNGGSFIG